MKLLLIQPPNINTVFCECPERFQGEVGFYPPLGLMYIAAYLQKFSNHQIEILDAFVEKLSYLQIKEYIKNHNPDVVGISATTFSLVDAYKTAQQIKQTKPDTLVILGGPHLSLYPEETLKLAAVDMVVIGEGELTMKELLDALTSGEALDQVAGIGYKAAGRLRFTKSREFIQDLDQLPPPARELTAYDKYYSLFSKDKISTYILTSRGCPYNCAFCFHHGGRRFRARSAANVVEEIEAAGQLGIKEFFIFDETFSVNQQRAQQICELIIKRKLEISFDIRTRVDTISEQLLRSLKQAGCRRVQYGVESGSQKILDVMQKGTTLDQVRQAFSLTKKIGITTYADFMLGFPEETKEDMRKTVSFAIELNPDFVQFSMTTLYPGTEIYQLAIDRGIVKNDFWRAFAEHPDKKVEPPLWTEHYSSDELMHILETAYSRFYLRPGYILKRLSKIRTPNEFLRHLRMGRKVIFK
ncbi:B12-binding domain-containing radical SAM protein [Candidatus Omnitrophota bacterium]